MEAISNKHFMENSSGGQTVHISEYEMKLFSKQLVAFTKQIMCDVVTVLLRQQKDIRTQATLGSVFIHINVALVQKFFKCCRAPGLVTNTCISQC